MKNVLLIWLLCIKLIHLSVVKGFIEEIVDAVPDIPYIDKIPSIVSQVNSIPSIISKVKNIPTIVSQVDNMVGVIYYGTDGIDRRRLMGICATCELARKAGIFDAQCDIHCPQSESAEGGLGFGSGIPGIGTAVEKVQDLAKKIPEIGTTLDTVQDLAEKIPEIVKIVRVFMSNPVGTFGVGNEVESLANTLETCLNQITELVDPKQAFDSILDIADVDLNIIGGISDIPDLTYKVLAFMLLPFKPAIELSCDKGLPMAIDILKTTVQKINGRRRRRMAEEEEEIPSERCPKSDSGDNIFCASEHISYFYDDTSNDMYRSMVHGFNKTYTSNRELIPKSRDNSDTEVVQEIRIARFTFELVVTIVDGICNAYDKCNPDIAGCHGVVACNVVKIIVGIINDALDYVLGSAELQDAEINNFRLKAIFNDRISIIHNQKLILDTIKENVLGTTNQIHNSENKEIYSLKTISEKIDQCGSAAKSEAGKFVMDGKENEGEIMIIKLKSIHLYYGIIIFMSGMIIAMFIGMFIGKFCCNGYNKSNIGFAPVPKYDYSTTDIDIDENK